MTNIKTKFAAAELKNGLSLLWDEALQGPVLITVHGRPKFVVLKLNDYLNFIGRSLLGNEEETRRGPK